MIALLLYVYISLISKIKLLLLPIPAIHFMADAPSTER